MDNRTHYHTSIIRKYSHSQRYKVHCEYSSSDDLILNATQFQSDSNTGILLIPGIWYPRESYYKLSSDLQKYFNVMVYDQRGHSLSQGHFNIHLMAKDLIEVAKQYIKQNNLQQVYITGHSLGGHISLLSSSMDLPNEIKGQILLASPLSFKSLIKNTPKNLTTFKVYILNLLKAIAPKYRSDIYKEYVSFNYFKFKKRPHIFALRADNPNNVVQELKSTKCLTEMVSDVHLDTLFIWGNNDSTLKIKKVYPIEYASFIKTNVEPSKNLDSKLIKKLSHQFNYDDKTIIQVSGDNKRVKDIIFNFIENGSH